MDCGEREGSIFIVAVGHAMANDVQLEVEETQSSVLRQVCIDVVPLS